MSAKPVSELLTLINDKFQDKQTRKQAFLDMPSQHVGASDDSVRISLADKLVPTADNAALSESAAWVTCWAEDVPVAELQARLRDGEAATPSIWSSEGQLSNDLSQTGLRRPYHDALGIEKIIFLFSDDLLTQCFRLPWWAEWERLYFRPIFERIGVRSEQLVRCLLARMPPGCLIDVHHDTGRWTTLTHRMHVPVFTHPPAVSFLSGRTADSMQRFDFLAGHCYELNNRAKHAVYNGWDQHRVHLIFDWIESDDAVRPPIRFRTLDSPRRGVVQHRRAMWYYDDDDDDKQQADDQDDPRTRYLEPVGPQSVRISALRRLLGLVDNDNAETLITKLLQATDLGEMLLADVRATLAQHFPHQANTPDFDHLFAACLSDPERVYAFQNKHVN